jgi:hypothetical protein
VEIKELEVGHTAAEIEWSKALSNAKSKGRNVKGHSSPPHKRNDSDAAQGPPEKQKSELRGCGKDNLEGTDEEKPEEIDSEREHKRTRI